MISYSPFRLGKILFIPCVLVVCGSFFILRSPAEEGSSFNLEDFKDELTENAPVAEAPLFSKIEDFEYLPLTAKPCGAKTAKILALVPSSPAHVAHRSAIRGTWGNPGQHLDISVRTVFIVGRSHVSMIQKRILQEAKVHGDLILVDLEDSYRNMTLKHLAGIKWALLNCPQVKFVVKIDDDAFVDMKRLAGKLDLLNQTSSLMCQVIPRGSSPMRSGKWGVTQEEYSHHQYPEYCSGLAYFTRQDTLAKVYDAAMFGRIPYLWIDDVFVTGFAAGLAKVKRVDVGVWFADSESKVVEWMKYGKGPCPWMVSEISVRYWPSDAVSLWKKNILGWLKKN